MKLITINKIRTLIKIGDDFREYGYKNMGYEYLCLKQIGRILKILLITINYF